MKAKVFPRIVLGVLLVALPLLAFWRGNLLYDRQFDSIAEQLKANGHVTAVAINEWVQARQSSANTIALVVGAEYARAAQPGIGEAASSSMVANHLTALSGVENYHGAWVVSAGGRVIASSQGAPPLEELELAAARETGMDGQQRIVDRSRSEGEGILSFVTPIAKGVGAGGAASPAAVVVRVDPLSTLVPLVRWASAGTKTGQTLLLARSGDEVVFLSPARLPAAEPLTLTIPAGEAPSHYLNRGQAPDEDVRVYRDHRGVETVAVSVPIGQTEWTLVRAMDRQEIRMLARRQVLREGATALVVLVSLILVFSYTSRRAGLAQIGKLGAISRELAAAQAIANVGSWKWSPSDGEITWSDQMYRTVGLAPQSLILTPEIIAAFVHPEDRRRFAATCRRIAARGGRSELEFRVVRSGGEIRYVCMRAEYTPESSGTLVGTMADISGQRKAAEQLASAEAHYRRLVENSPLGIFTTDSFGRITEANAAASAIVGEPVGALLGLNMLEIIAPEDRERAIENLRSKLATGGAAEDNEFWIVRSSGERRLLRTRSVPIVQRGEIVGTHGVVQDITEERERERQMQRAERLASIGTLLSGVAHELNNPLQAISNFAQLMLEEPRSPEDVEALTIMEREANRMAKIVSDLRLSARQSQEDSPIRTAVDVNEIIAHVLKVRRYTHESHDIRIEEDLAPLLPAVLASRSEIEQVILNLLLNAEHATVGRAAERLIRVSTHASSGQVILTIQDSGHGIAPENLGRIFDPFFSTKEPGEGTGLGLSLVHRIVEDHGGKIQATSAVGEGATFTLQIPVASTAGQPSRGGQPRSVPGATGLRILLADDEAALRTSMARYLRSRGHLVDEAGDGLEALHLIESAEGPEPYDAILSDLRMPRVGGEEFLRTLQSFSLEMSRRVVFLTGDSASTDVARILAATSNPLLVKPIPLAQIEQALIAASPLGKGAQTVSAA